MESSRLVWKCGSHSLSLELPVLMAIINVTPDSFSGDGVSGSVDAALFQAERALMAGARILDVGGESSRPGAASVSVQQELDRVVPVIEALTQFGVPVSVDTVKSEVMQQAIEAGASIINDINALQAPGALDVVANADVGLCVMHMQGEPRSMQENPHYADVVMEVESFIAQRCAALQEQTIDPARIAIDPGFGFGKRLEHNLELFRALPRFASMGFPVLVGVSRKTMLGQLTGQKLDSRLYAGVAAAVMAIQRGASILRVHDVEATRDALAVWAGIELNRQL